RLRGGSRNSGMGRPRRGGDWTSRAERAWNEAMSVRNGSGSGKWGRVWRYEGTRGVVWRIRYRDAAWRRALETLGREPEWDRERAHRYAARPEAGGAPAADPDESGRRRRAPALRAAGDAGPERGRDRSALERIRRAGARGEHRGATLVAARAGDHLRRARDGDA